MSSAYIEYDSMSEKLLKVSWTKTSTYVVEISKELAIDFLEGKEKINEYSIHTDNGIKSLVKRKTVKAEHFRFSNLLSIYDNIPDFEIKIHDHVIEIKVHDSKNNYILYACVKDDPSWLIKIWNLSEELDHNNTIKIFFKNASNYTYFIRKIL